MKQLSKKGFQIGDVPTLAVTFGVIAIILGVVATILTQIQSNQDSGSYAYNITQEGIDGQVTLSSWQTTWVIIVASAVVLGIVSAYLFMR